MVTPTVDVAETGLSEVAQKVKCVLVDGPDMQMIPGTTWAGTFPAGSSGMDLSVTINSYVPDVPVGELAVDCKDPQHAAPTTRAAHVHKASFSISPGHCTGTGGFIQNGRCFGSAFGGGNIGLPVSRGNPPPPPKAPKPPTATGQVQATCSSSNGFGISSAACKGLLGFVQNGKCVGGPFNGLPVSG
jgi:hypothetical protein